MKFLLSIAIGGLFLMIEHLSTSGVLSLGSLNFLGVENMGATDFSWIQIIADKLLHIPGIITNGSSQVIIDELKEYTVLTTTQVSLGITFTFYFIFSYTIMHISSKFRLEKDKKSILFGVLSLYILILYFL